MEKLTNKPKLKVLFLASDPSNKSRLHLGKELQKIRGKLEGNANFEIKDHLATKPNDVMNEIMNYQPHIVHFSGHGSSEGELCFEDEKGLAKTIPPEALASLFRIASEYVKCVVVNTCYAERQAKAIAQFIPVVVGTKTEISDEAATNFSTGFYTALDPDLSTESLKKAFNLGLISIQFDGNLEEHLTPIIIFGSANLRFTSEVDSALSNISNIKANAVKTLISGLTFIGRKMGLNEQEVGKIIDNKIWKLEQHNNSIDDYTKNLKAILRDEFPLSESSITALSYLQNGLSLSNADIEKIHNEILSDSKLDDAYSWYDRGNGQYQLKNYELAAEYFEKALMKKENYSAALAYKGTCKNKLGLYEEGIEALSEAIRLNENWEITTNLSLAYFDRGLCYFSFEENKEENLKKAIFDWKKTYEINPDEVSAIYNMGLAHEKLHNYESAIECYEKALKENYSNKANIYKSILLCYTQLGNSKKINEWSKIAAKQILPDFEVNPENEEVKI